MTMLAHSRVAPETDALVSYLPLPGYGLLPVNAFVIHAAEPVLVDTGMAAVRGEFMPLAPWFARLTAPSSR